MIVSILADLSVLMIAVLFFFLVREDRQQNEVYTRFEIVKFSSVITLVGIFLMKYSVVVDGARYDYRFLLYALTMKYLGGKVALPSLILITVFRVFWGIDIHMFSSFVYGIVLLLTMSVVNKWVKKIPSDFMQIVLLALYNLFIGALLNLIIYHDFFKNSHIYLVLAVSSIVMVFIFMWIRKQISAIYDKSEVDYLTSLLNSRKFYSDITREKTIAKVTAICMIDIDHFKQVNDQFGHLAGDDLLRQLTQVFLDYQNQQYTFYRVGGEEFACLVQESSLDQAISSMEVIRQKVALLETGLVDQENQEVQVTVSIGISTMNTPMDIHHSLRQSDNALYYSKASGRNRVTLATEDDFIEITK